MDTGWYVGRRVRPRGPYVDREVKTIPQRSPARPAAKAPGTLKPLTAKALTFKPVTAREWADLETLFSERGVQRGCWCMYWRAKRSDFRKHYGEGNRKALKQAVHSGRVQGILAYHKGRPIGWCSVAPREEFASLERSPTLKRMDDQPVWSIVCFFVSRPYRGRGVVKALVQAAVAYAKTQGARIVEAYPLSPEDAERSPAESYMGVTTVFERCGFREAIRRSRRRPILRFHLRSPSP